MKILHITPTYWPAVRYGGPIWSVHGLCRALSRLGHEVHVFTTSIDGPADLNVPLGQKVERDGVNVWYYPSSFLRRLCYSYSMQKAIKVRMHDFELIHTHSIYLWPTWFAEALARRKRIPYLLSPRGMLVKDLVRRKNRWLKLVWIYFMERENLEKASGIHVTSKIEKEGIAKFGLNLPPIYVVPNGIEISQEKMPRERDGEEKPRKEPPYVLFLGRVNWKKGLDRLIPAMKYVPHASLVIAGNDEENYQKRLERLAASFGVSGRIRFLGPVYGEEKIDWLSRASLFVLPSYSENFGVGVLEAMAVGCPVVVTPEVGLAEIVEATGCGSVVDGKPEILGPAIRDLLGKPELLRQMGEKGKAVVQERFTWNKIARQMEAVYKEIIEKHSRGSC